MPTKQPSPSRGLFVPHYVGGELRFPATTHLYKVKARPLVVTDYHHLKKLPLISCSSSSEPFQLTQFPPRSDLIHSHIAFHLQKIVHPLQYYSTSRFYFSSKILSSIQVLPWCPNFITLTPPQISPDRYGKKYRENDYGSGVAPLLPPTSQFPAISVA